MKYFYGLLVLVPVAGAFWFFDVGHTWIFLTSAGALVPLAALMSNATELIGEHTSPRIGALLNATFGNMAELIITVIALRSGLLQLVKASISGSIIGTSLLIMGSSMLLGGIEEWSPVLQRAYRWGYRNDDDALGGSTSGSRLVQSRVQQDRRRLARESVNRYGDRAPRSVRTLHSLHHFPSAA